MAWTQYIKSRIHTLDLVKYDVQPAIITVDRSIYVIGYGNTENELQVHIYHVDTCEWDIVRFTDGDRDSIPWNMRRFFAVAHDDSILVYAYEYSMEYAFFVFNTNTLQWNRLSTHGDSGNQLWWAGCCMHEELYTLKHEDNFRDKYYFELWALDLGTMRWRIVSDIELDFSYIPIHMIAYDTRIYIDFRVLQIGEETTNIRIVGYDTVDKTWEWLDAPVDWPYLQPPDSSFLYSQNIYCVSFLPNQREFAYRYSLDRKQWERIRFEGVPPCYIRPWRNVSVLDSKAYFINVYGTGLHVLDFEPTLETRCLAAVSRYKLDTSGLPASLQTELLKYKCTE